MRSLWKSEKGLSTVVTTLIILVVSVLLATVVTFYAINITTTRIESEDLKVSKAHIWTNSTEAQSAFVLINVGGRDVLLDKITVRDQPSDWTSVYYWFSNVSISEELAFATLPSNGTTASITVENATRTFTQASDDIAVPSGTTLVVYMDSPDSITVSDIGVTTRITIHSANAMYSKEVNVEYIS
ncbi:hypothetical protein GWO13_11250 [Candidatus Bathyarchaeota archaeon]|nr:hypothetical protein [Candidatus Bathyarchaeota archaeon]